ncbi:Xylanase inhibitor C-terminal [Arabidopsis suecica]|uniref:Xylanase inhibitor C-terminal n=1 Tax=Arabidopsis suecica TaxID=45249 RepID=A0A8T2BSW0_ARASU|nr:Xylanase inhibitor C-terminal [Arabidopsis suecica]
MAGMGRHNIGLPPQFAAAFSFSQKFAVRNPQSILTAIKIVEKKQFQRLKINASIGFGGTKISSVNPYTVLESSIYKAFTLEFVKQTAATNITRVASEKPFGDACFSTKNVGVTRLGYAAPEIQLLLRSNDVVWRIFRANSMVSVSDDVICLGFVDGVNLCGVHIDCTVLVLFIFSPSSSAQPSFRPKALLLPVAKDKSTLQYTTVINQHIPLVPASVVFDLGGRELWVDCDKDYVSSTYQSPRCNYAECSRAGSTSCGTCFSPPRPGCRLASGTVGMAGMGRHNIGLPPQFAAAFSFSQKFAVRNPQSILTAIKIVEKKQFQRLKINASIGFGGTKISSVNPYTVLESSIYKAFTSEFVKQTAARNITRVASEKPFGDACFSTKNVGVTRLGYAAPEIQLLLRSNDVVWRIFRANSMVSVSDDVICLGFVDGVNLCGVHYMEVCTPVESFMNIGYTRRVHYKFSSSSHLHHLLLLPVAKDKSTLQYTTVINQHIPLVPASVVFDLGGRELWVDCDKDYVSSTYQSPRCNYAECSRAGSTSCGTCFSPPKPGCRLASGTVGMARMGRHNIGLPPQFAAAFSFSQKFAVRNPQSILTAIKIVEKKQFQRLKINASIGFGGTKISSVNPYTVLESSIYKAFTSEFVKQTAARNITRVASEKPFGDACFSTKNVGVTRLGYAAPEIQLLLRSNDVVWRIFRANSMVSVSDDVICLGFVDGVNLCGVHIDCTVLVLFIFSPSSSAQPSFRPKALLLPVAKDQSTLQYTTVINQHIPLVPASVVFDLGGRELWVDCDKDYVSSTYQSPRCNYAECSRAGSTSCGTCFSPPRPGCRLASGTVGMAGMGRHNIGLPPQFAAAFSFSQKFAVRNPQSILTAIKIVEKKQFQRLKINASIGFGGTKISSVNPYTVLESSIYKAFTSEFVKQTAARNITRVASEKPFGDACFSTKNVGVTRLGYAAPEIQLLLRSNDVVWRIFRANSMVSVSDDVICLGFVDGVNLCGVHIDCTVLVLFIFSPSSSAQPSFRPKALLLPVAKDQSTLQYTTVINQHIPLVPASVVFDLGGRELWVDCDKDYVSSTYQSPRCNYAECSRAGSTSCGTCFSPPRPGCRLASGTVGMAGMGRHNIGLPPQFAAAFSFSQKFAVCLIPAKVSKRCRFSSIRIGFGGTKISSVNPYTVLESSIYKAFTSEFVKQTAARNITRVASEKPFGDACFSTKNVGVTRLGYAAPEIQLLLRSNDVVWRIFRANSMVSVSDDVICLGFVDGVNLCGVHIDCTVIVLFIFSPSSSAQPSFRPKALLLPVAKDQSTLQYTTVINQHIPLVPASVVFDLGGRELWVDCDKDYVSSTYQSPRCNYAECSRAGSTSCGTCFSPPRPGCRLASGTVGMAGMGRHNIGLPPQFAAAFGFSQKFAVCLIPAKVSKRCRFSSIGTKNVGVTRLGYAAPEIQLLLRSNDIVWRIFRANSMVAMSTTKERSSHNRNKRLIEALTTEMGQIFDSHLDSIRQGHHRARKRKEQELKPKPSDNSLGSKPSSPQKIPHTPKSKSVFYSEFKPTNALFKFSGKGDYLEWEKNMDEWFSYKNFLSEKRFVSHGLAVQEKGQALVSDSKKNPIAEKQFEDELLKILNAYNKPKKAKSAPQPKMVTEEVVVHKQSLNPSPESSGEPKQCKSSNLSKKVTCYKCRKKGHLAATCHGELELTISSLESKLSSSNSSSEVINQGLEKSSSCVMHLFLSKDVDSGHTMENENDKAEGSTKEENHHLVSTTSQACRADYVSNITIFKAEILPNILRGNQVSLACEFIQYWNNFTFTRTFKQPVLNVGISSIIHLILSLSAKEDAGTIDVCNDMPTNSELMTCSLAIKESEDVNNTILKEKEPPYVSQPVLNRELPKEATRELGGFTQAKAVLVHNQSPRAECNILVKEKPPDATPPIKTRGNYLNSQKRMKANLLSLGEGFTIWRPIKKTTDREISTHHMSQSRDSREDYQNQLRLKHKEECIGKQSNLFVRASKVKNALLSKHQCLLLNCEKALMSLTNLTPVLPSEMMSLLQDYEGMLSEEKSIGLPTIHDASQSRIWRPGLGRSRPIPYEILVTLLHMFPEEPKMDLSSLGSFHTYQWRPGEFLDTFREDELVTNNALIQEEPRGPTPRPLTVMISSTEHTTNLIKDNALIKVEACLLVYSDSMTMITHLLFAKAVDNIAGIKEEPPDIEVLSSNLFERTGIGVVLMPRIDSPSNLTRRRSDNAYALELQGELDLRSNPFQVGEDDMILETTKDLECDKELVAEEELEPEEQLEPEEHFERDNELVAEKEYGKDVHPDSQTTEGEDDLSRDDSYVLFMTVVTGGRLSFALGERRRALGRKVCDLSR